MSSLEQNNNGNSSSTFPLQCLNNGDLASAAYRSDQKENVAAEVRHLKEQLKQREELIRQLSERLQATLSSRDDYLGQAEKMASEIRLLEGKMRELSSKLMLSNLSPRSNDSRSSASTVELVRRDVACSYEDITEAAAGNPAVHFDRTKEDFVEHDEIESFGDITTASSDALTITSAKEMTSIGLQTDLTIFELEQQERVKRVAKKLTFDERRTVSRSSSPSPMSSDQERSNRSSSESPVFPLPRTNWMNPARMISIHEQPALIQLSPSASFISTGSTPTLLNDVDIDSGWHLNAAQTNSRLLNVLSDLVKAFLDTESDIQRQLEKMGFSPDNAKNGKEDFLPSLEDAMERLSLPGDLYNGELCEDGPDLIAPAAAAMNVHHNQAAGAGSSEDDVVLGASRRLRQAVDRIIGVLRNMSSENARQEAHVPILQKGYREISAELKEEAMKREKLAADLLEYEEKVKIVESAKNKLEEKLLDMEELERQLAASEKQLEQYEAIFNYKDQMETIRKLDARVKEVAELREQLRLERVNYDESEHFYEEKLIGLNEDLEAKTHELVDLREKLRIEREHWTDLEHMSEEKISELTNQLDVKTKEVIDVRERLTLLQLSAVETEQLKDEKITELSKQLEAKQVELTDLNERTILERTNAAENDFLKEEKIAELNKQLKGRAVELSNLRDKLALERMDAVDTDHIREDKLSELTKLLEAKSRELTQVKSAYTEVSALYNKVITMDQRQYCDSPQTLEELVSKTNLNDNSESTISSRVNCSYLDAELLDSKLKDLNQVMDMLIKKNEELQAELDAVSTNETGTSAKMKELEELNSNYKKEISKLENSFVAERERVSKMKELVEVLRLERLSAAETETLNDEKIIELSDKLNQKTRETVQLSAAYKQIQTMYSNLIRQKTESMTRKIENGEDCDSPQPFESMQTEISEGSTVDGSFLDAALLDSKLKDLNKVMDLLIKKNESLQKQLKDARGLKSVLDSSNRKIRELDLKIEQLSQTNAKLESELSSKMIQITSLKREALTANLFQSPSTDLVRNLKKCLHQKRALIYQKKYLLNVLGGFQLTEKATLALIANMNVSLDDTSLTMPTPKSRFRSVVLATIALSRMKMLVRKWGEGHRSSPGRLSLPPLLNQNVQPCVAMAKHSTARTKPNAALSQPPFGSHHYRPNSPTSSLSSTSSFERKSSQTNATLEEFVTRLQRLHSTLGLRSPIDVVCSPPHSLTISEDDDDI